LQTHRAASDRDQAVPEVLQHHSQYPSGSDLRVSSRLTMEARQSRAKKAKLEDDRFDSMFLPIEAESPKRRGFGRLEHGAGAASEAGSHFSCWEPFGAGKLHHLRQAPKAHAQGGA
jgi:hypothetical protein